MNYESFWDFSLRVYADKDVADTCLTLQEGFGLDVNLVLFCLWHGEHFGSFPASVLDAAFDFSLQWRERVVQPLRSSRRWMKESALSADMPATEYANLRSNIKRMELQAERLQQNKLASLVTGKKTISPQIGRQAKEENLAAYLQALVKEHDPEISKYYARLVCSMSNQDK